MKKLTILIGIASLAVVSCKKEEVHSQCENQGISYITSSDLLNSRYKTGTYWVYIDSVSMQSDSTYITEFNQEMMSDCGYTFQTHWYNTKSDPSSEVNRYIVVAGGLFKGFNGSVGSGTLLYDPPKPGYLIDSVFICDRYYYDVKRMEIASDPTEGDKHSIYYINSGYGILKHEIYDGNTLVSQKLLKSKYIVR